MKRTPIPAPFPLPLFLPSHQKQKQISKPTQSHSGKTEMEALCSPSRAAAVHSALSLSGNTLQLGQPRLGFFTSTKLSQNVLKSCPEPHPKSSCLILQQQESSRQMGDSFLGHRQKILKPTYRKP